MKNLIVQKDKDGLLIVIDNRNARPDHDYNFSEFKEGDVVEANRLGKTLIIDVKKVKSINECKEYWRIKK